jgi:NAD(P)-dependent dehydrogenase (short-subunit alcohol dehydrogenase family)
MKAFSLSNSSVLVTGSSRGIGLAAGLALREAGAEVLFHGREASPAGVPQGAAYLAHDLADRNGPGALAEEAFAAAPALDLLVCNAGSFFDSSFLEMTEERWDNTMNLNVRATYFLIQAFAARLARERRPGAVVIVSSTNGFQAEEDSTAYDTSKGALVMMTRSLSLSLAQHRIRVNGVAPGLIRTPLTAPWIDAEPDKRRHYEKKILLGRIGVSEDCAGAITFLCSPAAAYITGQILVVDGGLTVGQIGKME